MRYEVFTLGKHFLQVHTSKGFTLFANAKLNPNGEVVSYTDTMSRRGGSWVIDTWKFLTIKAFPENPIYCAVFGFDDNDTEVQVNATDIDVDSISGVNGQLVDIGNISLPVGQALPVRELDGVEQEFIKVEKVDGVYNIPDLTGFALTKVEGFLRVENNSRSVTTDKLVCYNFFSMIFGGKDRNNVPFSPHHITNIQITNEKFVISATSTFSTPAFAEHEYTFDQLFLFCKCGFRCIVSNGQMAYILLFVN